MPGTNFTSKYENYSRDNPWSLGEFYGNTIGRLLLLLCDYSFLLNNAWLISLQLEFSKYVANLLGTLIADSTLLQTQVYSIDIPIVQLPSMLLHYHLYKLMFE